MQMPAIFNILKNCKSIIPLGMYFGECVYVRVGREGEQRVHIV